MLLAGTACAAVPDATLASLGLGGMQQMTDAQGMNVRGMGASISVTYSITSVAEIISKSGATTETETILSGTASADHGDAVGIVGGGLAGVGGLTASFPPTSLSYKGGVSVAVGGFYAFTTHH
jgi:hypothetical protein